MTNLQELYEKISSDSDLTETQKRDLRSAVTTLGRWLALPLNSVTADPRLLRARLSKLSAVRLGVKPKRLQNVVSGINVTLRRFGAIPKKLELNSDWRDLRGQMPDKYMRGGQSAFSGYC